MKHPHLVAAALAAGLAYVVTAVLGHYAHSIEIQDERKVAADFFPIKNHGVALQRIAFKTAHFLPIYGSSELGDYKLQKLVDAVPGEFFIRRPTGFSTFPVGHGGTTPLVILQDLASIGKPVAGHKVVVVISPSWFVQSLDPVQYAGNAPLLHTASLVFGDYSRGLKRDVSRRLLQFPETLEKSALLSLTMKLYADGGYWHFQMARVLTPAGRTWLWFLGLIDDFNTVKFLENPAKPIQDAPPVEREKLDWAATEVAAEPISNVQSQMISPEVLAASPELLNKPLALKHPFKLPSSAWQKLHPPIDVFSKSDIWGDYELLLRVLQESQARPLILSIPQDGLQADTFNRPYGTRRVYYDRVKQGAAKYHFPVFTFEEHEYDGNFLIDHASHLTEKGWLFFDQVIDVFYHDKTQL